MRQGRGGTPQEGGGGEEPGTVRSYGTADAASVGTILAPGRGKEQDRYDLASLVKFCCDSRAHVTCHDANSCAISRGSAHACPSSLSPLESVHEVFMGDFIGLTPQLS